MYVVNPNILTTESKNKMQHNKDEENVFEPKRLEGIEEGSLKENTSPLSGKALKGSVKNNRKKKDKKHFTNCKDKMTKAVLGATILSRLGKVQQDTQDNIKREILKSHKLSEFAEAVSEEPIPEYQKRFMDMNQQRNMVQTYELDDGPLTDEQNAAIREASPVTNLPEERITRRLF